MSNVKKILATANVSSQDQQLQQGQLGEGWQTDFAKDHAIISSFWLALGGGLGGLMGSLTGSPTIANGIYLPLGTAMGANALAGAACAALIIGVICALWTYVDYSDTKTYMKDKEKIDQANAERR